MDSGGLVVHPSAGGGDYFVSSSNFMETAGDAGAKTKRRLRGPRRSRGHGIGHGA